MNCKYFIVNGGGNGKVVKHIGEILPNCEIVEFSLTLHVESIVLGDSSCFVVASDHKHSFGIADFQQTQKCDNFDAVGSSVYIVPKEEVTCVWKISTYFKNF